MAWRRPMAQFSWWTALAYSAGAMVAVGLIQAHLLLPGVEKWRDEARRRRDESSMLRECQAQSGRSLGAVFDLRWKLFEAEQKARRYEDELRRLRGKTGGGAARTAK